MEPRTDEDPSLTLSPPGRVAGCDLGKSAAKFVEATLDATGHLVLVDTEVVEHEGRAVDAFQEWYRRRRIDRCVSVGATGVYADRLGEPLLAGLPEDACLAAALPHLTTQDGPVNLVSIGARGYSVLSRDASGDVTHVENDKCSSGTGETMLRIAGRFGLGIVEADELAWASDEAIPITARCSVFAKSEMTHFGNQGRPAPALFRGYFGSIARYVAALLGRAQVDGPLLVVGGCSRLSTIVAALGDASGKAVEVPELALYAEAVGAAVLAAEQSAGQALEALPADPAALVRERSSRFVALEPASHHSHRVTRLESQPVAQGSERRPCVLGVDLGSTGSKAVLTDLDSGEMVLDLYDRTRGNPVDALQRLLDALLARTEPDVRSIALTGSGREAAAAVLRAAFPDAANRILTLNEIVAHATAAIRCDDRGGTSLSIVEIGGQDAKFIQIVDGMIVESDMNKACSAGTGSFLEEQANLYGVDDITDFTRLASEATRPPDLGQMCTVFVADAAADARNEGYEIADLFSGFEHSVIHNYINRVMGQRAFGQRVFFQGKPATAESLAWTLAAITGREVVVPANPGAMGAWGIGLVAMEELGTAELTEAAPFDLSVVLAAEVVERSEFQCRDQRCATLCSIERTKVDVRGQRQSVLSGGACPRYEVASGAKAKLPIDAPSAFDERAGVLEQVLADLCVDAASPSSTPGERLVGIPEVGACVGWMPWLATFVRGLGLAPVRLSVDASSLARGEERCYSYDSCAPAKIAHAVVDGPVDRVFFPKVLTLADRDGCEGKTCPVEQAAPDMVRESLRTRGRDIEVISPLLSLADEVASPTARPELIEVAHRLAGSGVTDEQISEARRAAADAQRSYESRLACIGRATLDWGRAHGVPVVPVCGPLHVIHDPVVNAGIPRLLRENGALVLPMDCYPIPDEVPELPRIWWSESLRALRVALASRQRGDSYPLLISSFGCGPNSFVEQLFAAVLEGHPNTTLESDGHGGTAGYTTRVQAFLHAVRRHDGQPTTVSPERMKVFEQLPNPPARSESESRFVVFAFSDWLTPMIAATYRAHGLDAVAAGPNDSESLRKGRSDCSGKECLPYQLMWGSFRKHLDQKQASGEASGEGDGRREVLVQVTGEGSCRNCMFSIKDQLNLERVAAGDVAMRDFQLEPTLGVTFAQRLATSLTAWDILFQLVSYHRPLELHPGEADELYQRFCHELESITAHPRRDGLLGGARAVGSNLRATTALVGRAAEAFAELGERAAGRDDLRTVLLSGDIFLRIDEFAGDNIIGRLNERGLLVAVEPSQTFGEYFTYEQVRELARFPKGDSRRNVIGGGVHRVRKHLYKRVIRIHPWLPDGAVEPILEASRPLIDRHPIGEAPITVGSVLHHWDSALCDGAVMVSPWGCGPALISESILRHQRHIPMLFVYGDGSPIDERRLNAFAFRLKRSPARTGPASSVSSGSAPARAR